MTSRRGASSLGLLLAIPLLASEVGAQRMMGEAVAADRARQVAAVDAARIAGQRWAEALATITAARSASLGGAARLFGVTGIQAAAASVGSPDAARWGQQIVQQSKTLAGTIAAPTTVLRQLERALPDELGELAQARGFDVASMQPALPTLDIPGGVKACGEVFQTDPTLHFSPGALSEATAAARAGTYLPFGPAAFAGAFGASVAACAQGPLALLAAPPDTASFVVTLTAGDHLTGAVIELEADAQGSTVWRARLRHGESAPLSADPRLALIP